MRTVPQVLLSVPLALLLSACGGEQTMATPGTTDGVTFADVAPIYAARCASCHQQDGIAPFRLDNYEDAAVWSSASASATAARTMPPFLVVGDGTCGEFSDSQWLTDEEIATIGAWAEAGAPQGEPTEVTIPALPTLSGETVRVTTPTFTPEIVGGQLAEFDEYRCFAVDLPEGGSRFLTGYDVVPGNDAIVHHVIGMPVDYDAPGWSGDQTNGEIIASLEEPGRDGWPCFDGAGAGVSFAGEIVTWAPGQGAVELPQGTGLGVAENTRLVMQVHYNLADPATHGQSDQTAIDLRLEDAVTREAFVVLPDLFLSGDADVDSLAPGQPNAEVSFELPFEWFVSVPVNLELIGILPHMHERGRRMSVGFSHADGSPPTCAAEVVAWNFEWQRVYFYDEPIRFSSQDTLDVVCGYDTTTDTEPVLPGWGTQNEMCLPGLFVTLAQ